MGLTGASTDAATSRPPVKRDVDHQRLTSHEVELSASTPRWYVNQLQALNCLLIDPYLFVCIFHIAYFSSFWVSDNIQSRCTFFSLDLERGID